MENCLARLNKWRDAYFHQMVGRQNIVIISGYLLHTVPGLSFLELHHLQDILVSSLLSAVSLNYFIC